MKKLAIGIDIGGINTAFGLVDENGDLYADSVVSTKKLDRKSTRLNSSHL